MRWEAEACDLAPDPQSGAAITRLTSAVMSNINIYFEQPFATPDGKRVAYLRAQSSDPRHPPGQQLCVADLDMKKVKLIDDQIECHWVATCAWSGQLMYRRANGELIGVDLNTLEKRIVMTQWPLSVDAQLWAMSPDQRYVFTVLYDWQWQCNVVRVDVRDGDCQVIFRHPEAHTHVQVNHATGRDVLLQRTRGLRINHLGERRRDSADAGGSTHVLMDIDGGTVRELAIGEPHTASSTGHATWVADTGCIATPVRWPGMRVDFGGEAHRPAHDARHPQGNMIVVGPDRPAEPVPAPEHLFNHASVSRCGRYFVADSYRHGVPGAIELVVGDLNTGQCRTLVSDCGAQAGGAASSHPHPYLTADNRRVIYNADPHHICHLHMAELPAGFLASLASPASPS